ncbi:MULTISPECIES: YfcZ/YiiS family protein [unclassified Agarivorans]|uniref:YfcZ/YiiS family protein n=1 Tax=unclassified Agarivorans TaxID=2636026 RepID=UPI003D7DADAE
MKTKLEESKTCCCVDVGAVIDGEDCSVVLEELFADKAQAESRLNLLIEKARKAESDPCEITSEFTEIEGGVQLNASFTFCCQAESLIFQLGLNR